MNIFNHSTPVLEKPNHAVYDFGHHCPYCTKSHASKAGLGQHRIRCQKNPNRRTWTSHTKKCEICERKFKSAQGLGAHSRVHKRELDMRNNESTVSLDSLSYTEKSKLELLIVQKEQELDMLKKVLSMIQ